MQPTENFGFIDHILLFSPSAAATPEYIREKTGVTPEYGGEHTGIGTCNYLLSLNDYQYLEILAPLKEAGDSTQGESDWVKACRSLEQPKPYTFCVAVKDFGHLTNVLNDNGITTSGPISMQRQRPDGALLKWQLLTCFDCRFGAVFPFFIKWDDCEHPATTSPGGCCLQSFAVRHPQHEDLSAVFNALDMPIPVKQSQISALDVVLSTPVGAVEL